MRNYPQSIIEYAIFIFIVYVLSQIFQTDFYSLLIFSILFRVILIENNK